MHIVHADRGFDLLNNGQQDNSYRTSGPINFALGSWRMDPG